MNPKPSLYMQSSMALANPGVARTLYAFIIATWHSSVWQTASSDVPDARVLIKISFLH